jgi:hypothetical protein
MTSTAAVSEELLVLSEDRTDGKVPLHGRLFAVSSGLLRVRWGQVMYAGLGLVRVGRGSLAAVR